jgi:hypothetical protein
VEIQASIEAQLPFPVKPGDGSVYVMAKFGSMLSLLNAYLARLLESGIQSINDGRA